MRALVLAAALGLAAPAWAQTPEPHLTTLTQFAEMRRDAGRYPLFASELRRTRDAIDAAILAGVDVPVPKDPAGGFTHEQHRRNYRTIYGAGLLYRLTGEQRYADCVRDLLLAYARLYPTLGPHPAKANQTAGRLFWQSLNDSVFLVNAIQGYDAARAAIGPADRALIERNALRPMARFLSEGSAESFSRIHNHATWAAAAVGMTGYVLGDRDLVDKALLGLDKRGTSGFLRQLDQLFSPDGYYTEGPYYQRYALQPFVLFASAIAANDPSRDIFAYRDGIVLKAVKTAIQLTYAGRFFPINDAVPEKSLRTEELYLGVAIAYAATGDPGLLSIADWQGHTVLSAAGLTVARDLAAGKARPFAFASALFRDGPTGTKGALAVLRSGPRNDAAVLVAKNTAQGMGHGHFDKLNWLFFDNGRAIVTDYGAARFLNVEAKHGGRYLPENDTWAQQTIAHNTLVVDETSHFGGSERLAETIAPTQLSFEGEGSTRWSVASVKGAYPDVVIDRALLMVSVPGLPAPLVVDVVHTRASAPHRYDLPLHFSGQIIDTDLKLHSNVAERPVLGAKQGYQHLWVDGSAPAGRSGSRVTWMTGERFYTYRMLPPEGAQVLIVESGANDPEFNLRREPAVIQRADQQRAATFVSVLEAHGYYDPETEITAGAASQIARISHRRAEGVEWVSIALNDGRSILLTIADDATPGRAHRHSIDGVERQWTGPVGRFDLDGKR